MPFFQQCAHLIRALERKNVKVYISTLTYIFDRIGLEQNPQIINFVTDQNQNLWEKRQ